MVLFCQGSVSGLDNFRISIFGHAENSVIILITHFRGPQGAGPRAPINDAYTHRDMSHAAFNSFDSCGLIGTRRTRLPATNKKARDRSPRALLPYGVARPSRLAAAVSRQQLRVGFAHRTAVLTPQQRERASRSSTVCRLAVRIARPGLLGTPGLAFLVRETDGSAFASAPPAPPRRLRNCRSADEDTRDSTLLRDHRFSRDRRSSRPRRSAAFATAHTPCRSMLHIIRQCASTFSNHAARPRGVPRTVSFMNG